MSSLRELRTRIKSVSATRKITKAQELIATSRVAKAKAQVQAALPYVTEMTKALQQLAAVSSLDHILIKGRPQVRRVGIIVYTSDRGMCGAYNNNVLRETNRLVKLLQEQNKEPVLLVAGAKGLAYYIYRNQQLGSAWSGFSQSPTVENLRPVLKFIQSLITAGSDDFVSAPAYHGLPLAAVGGNAAGIYGVDELYLVSTKFISMVMQRPHVRRIAPLDIEIDEIELISDEGIRGEVTGGQPTAQYIFDPEPELLLDLLLPRYLGTRLFAAALESSASESASRRTAMKAASDNASELVKTLQRHANLARQAQITSQISEIVGATAALGV